MFFLYFEEKENFEIFLLLNSIWSSEEKKYIWIHEKKFIESKMKWVDKSSWFSFQLSWSSSLRNNHNQFHRNLQLDKGKQIDHGNHFYPLWHINGWWSTLFLFLIILMIVLFDSSRGAVIYTYWERRRANAYNHSCWKIFKSFCWALGTTSSYKNVQPYSVFYALSNGVGFT